MSFYVGYGFLCLVLVFAYELFYVFNNISEFMKVSDDLKRRVPEMTPAEKTKMYAKQVIAVMLWPFTLLVCLYVYLVRKMTVLQWMTEYAYKKLEEHEAKSKDDV